MVEQLGTRVNAANALNRETFLQTLMKQDYADCIPGHEVSFETSFSISVADFKSCLNLVEETSKAAYSKSSRGWSRHEKKQEMRESDMRFLLVKRRPRDPSLVTEPSALRRSDPPIIAFLSFMLTVEDDMQVVYCYEVHVHESARGSGIGSTLMNIMSDIGVAARMEKAMLTVFTSNASAIRLYERIGYAWYDEEPIPPQRRLRGRVTAAPKPSYVILIKDLM